MALLGTLPFRYDSRRSAGRGRAMLALCAVLLWPGSLPAAGVPATREYQLKAVFLFNFAQFVEWPATAFADAQAPLVIGVLGDDPFGASLDDTVRGEKVGDRRLTVERYHRAADIRACHILFISRSETARLEEIFAAIKGRSILTVGDTEGFAQRGGMIRFQTEDNKTRLRIGLETAKSAGLTLSSKLLRPAEIVAPGKD